MTGAAPFRVLFVCTANRFRSPMAEHLMRGRCARAGLDWEVSSAGIEAREGERLDPRVVKLLERQGSEPFPWLSRSLGPELVDGSDLVLTATVAQRSRVAAQHPHRLHHIFTLLQFARYARSITPAAATTSGAELLQQVQEVRGTLQPIPESSQDIADPAGHSTRTLRSCCRLIDEALADIVHVATGRQDCG